MNVFRLQSQLIKDYSTYIRSFITISDERIGDHVIRELEDGALKPDCVPNADPEGSLRHWLTSSASGILGGRM